MFLSFCMSVLCIYIYVVYNHSKHLSSIYWVLGMILSTYINLFKSYNNPVTYCHPYLTVEEAEAQRRQIKCPHCRVSNWRAPCSVQAVWPQSLLTLHPSGSHKWRYTWIQVKFLLSIILYVYAAIYINCILLLLCFMALQFCSILVRASLCGNFSGLYA